MMITRRLYTLLTTQYQSHHFERLLIADFAMIARRLAVRR